MSFTVFAVELCGMAQVSVIVILMSISIDTFGNERTGWDGNNLYGWAIKRHEAQAPCALSPCAAHAFLSWRICTMCLFRKPFTWCAHVVRVAHVTCAPCAFCKSTMRISRMHLAQCARPSSYIVLMQHASRM